MSSKQMKFGKWDVEIGVNIDGELVVYAEHEKDDIVHIHTIERAGSTPCTHEVEGANFAGALFYIDGDMT